MKSFLSIGRIIILGTMAFIVSSCFSYKQVAIPKEEITIDEQFIILHQGQEQWFVYDAFVAGDTISGTICSVIDQSLVPRFIHVYLFSDFELPKEEHASISIPFEAINSIEVTTKNSKKSFAYTASAIGFFMLIGGLFILIFN